MRWAPLKTVGGLCVALVAACSDGAAAPFDGSTTPDAGNAGNAGTGGAGGGAGGVQGTGGVQGAGGAAGSVPSTGGAGGTGSGGGAGATAALSFATDIWPVFSQVRNPPFNYRGMGTYSGCTTASPCHGSANPGARLNMIDAGMAYSALVNVASTTSLCATGGATVRVIPGDPDRSCLVQFYVGRLKDDLKWVDQAEIDLVRRWIADGARP